LRNLVNLIPFPLNGVAGFDHSRLKELEGGEVLAVVLILFQRNLVDKVTYFVNKVANFSLTQEERIKGAVKPNEGEKPKVAVKGRK